MTIEKNPLGNTLRYAASGKKKKPIVAVEKDPELLSAIIPTILGGFDRFKLTPDRLAAIISDADAGDPREQAALFSTIQEKEPIIGAHLQTRRLAVLSCPWEIRSDAHPKEAEAMTKELQKAGLSRAMGHLLDAVGTGYAGVSVDWEPGAARVKGFVPIMPDVFMFDEGGFPAIIPYVGASEKPISEYHPAQILYVTGEAKIGLPCRKGLMRTLLWMYLFKNAAFRDWGVFLERFGIPFILGKIPSGDFNNKEKRETLLKALLGVRSGGVGVGTTETDMQILNGAASGNQTAYEAYQRYCDEIITLCILGQLASSDKAGGLSKGTAQEQVRQDILAADCNMLSEVINGHLVRYMAELSYSLPPDDFEFVIDYELPEDMNISAERDAKIAAATGCKLSRKYAMEKYGVELEEPEPPPPQLQMPNNVGKNGNKSDNEGENGNDGGDNGGKPSAQFSDLQGIGPADKIVKAAMSRMVEADAFAAWRIPIDGAIAKVFGDLDPESETLVEDFRERAPKFLEARPGLMDAFTADDFVKNLQGALLASYLNGILPADFWRRKGTAK